MKRSTSLKQFVRVLAVDVSALTLAIGTTRPTIHGSLVGHNPQPVESINDLLLVRRMTPLTIGILDTKNELPTRLASEGVVEEGDIRSAYMRIARRRRCDSCANGHDYLLGASFFVFTAEGVRLFCSQKFVEDYREEGATAFQAKESPWISDCPSLKIGSIQCSLVARCAAPYSSLRRLPALWFITKSSALQRRAVPYKVGFSLRNPKEKASPGSSAPLLSRVSCHGQIVRPPFHLDERTVLHPRRVPPSR